MSAQTSQTSLNSNPPIAKDDIRQNPVAHSIDTETTAVASEVCSPTLTASAKRKFVDEDGDDDANTSANKRSKTVDFTTSEETEHLDATAIAHLKAQTSGPLHKVCQQPHPISRPHASQNLISLFCLDGLAAGVARRDPNTGEKVNKLRKSYESQIKDIPGKNKATTDGSNFLDLLYYPDEEWQIQRVGGRDVSRGLEDDMLSKLELAVQSNGSILPKDDYDRWKGMIALDEPPVKVMGPPAIPAAVVQAAQQAGMGYAANEPARVSRRGTKRRYDDESFEGYGEGFVDDSVAVQIKEEHDEALPELGVKRKKRRDEASSPRYATTFSPITVGNGSYSMR